ncbi:MAG: class I SAM-dependent methyltransferase [Planctomycetota bacterium]|jgi:SAM-dependent methyltransferase
MLKVGEITTRLKPGECGIWFPTNRSQISYPEDGNIRCLKIEADSFWFTHRNNCIVEVIRLYPPDGPVLDVGGGNGFVSLAINNAGVDTIFLEPGFQGCINAHNRGISPIICSTLEDAAFKPHSIPAIGIFDLLEHIENDVAFLSKLKTLLIPNGRLYITVPAYDFLSSFDDKRAGHYRRYTTKSLSKKLTSIGFAVEFKTYIFRLLPVPILLFRTIPSKLGLRKKSELEKVRKEHDRPAGWLSHLLTTVLDTEIKQLRSKKAISFGGSCLVVATVPKS